MAFWSKRDPAPYLKGAEQQEEKPAPKYVDETRFNDAISQVQSINTKLDQFTGMFTSMMGAPSVPGQAQTITKATLPDIPDITDAEYEDALFKSDATKIAIRTRAEVARATRASDDKWEARFNDLEAKGFAALDVVSGEVNQGALNTMPYYQILKTDVDAALATLPPHQRTPMMREHVYHAVVGKNLDKVRAHDAAESVRIEAQRNAPGSPSRGQYKNDGPTASSVFGDDIIAPGASWKGGSSLWGRGKSPDQWAQSHYGVENIQEAAVYASNVLAISDCHTCFSPIVAGKCHCRRSA